MDEWVLAGLVPFTQDSITRVVGSIEVVSPLVWLSEPRTIDRLLWQEVGVRHQVLAHHLFVSWGI